MIKKKILSDWTEREKWLLGLLIVSLVGGALLFLAWKRDLVPWATEYGTVAEWIAAFATAAGLAWAVYTLRVNARDEKDRREAQQRAEASRVAIVWDDDVERFFGFRGSRDTWTYSGRIHNAGSYPLSSVTVSLNGVDGIFFKDNNEESERWETARQSFGTLMPGADKLFSFTLSWTDSKTDNKVSRVTPHASLDFVDAQGSLWTIAEATGLKKIQNARKYEEASNRRG